MKRLSLLLLALLLITSCATFMPNSELNTLLVEADAAMESADWNKAAQKYEAASTLQPENLDIKLKQALAYQRAGKLAKAYNLYQIIIDSGKGAQDSEAVKTAKTNQAKFGFNSQKESAETANLSDGKQDSEPVSFYASNPEVPTQNVVTTEAIALPEPIVASEPKPLAAAEDKTVVDNTVLTQQITTQLNEWAKAWQNKDLTAYYAHYTPDFAGEFADNKAWRKARQQKIKAGKQLKVEISDITVEPVNESAAKASFTQQYQSNLYRDTGKKHMELRLVDGRWLIASEQFVKQ